jgi:hypothetical protein
MLENRAVIILVLCAADGHEDTCGVMNMRIQFFQNEIPSLFMQHSPKTHFSTLLRLQLLEILAVTLRLRFTVSILTFF